jgi:hypothetical protein|tara:strand:- start:13 stop:372 length:360 start_codon:yes stop_codon:yes gene_type:complete
MALPRDAPPETFAELMQPFSFLSELTLNPALEAGTVGSTTEQKRLISRKLSGGGELGCTASTHAFAPLSFPAQSPRLPKHFALQRCGQILLLHPMVRISMGIAVSHAITEGVAVSIGIS